MQTTSANQGEPSRVLVYIIIIVFMSVRAATSFPHHHGNLHPTPPL